MNIYMVSLADPEGREQRVVLQAPESDNVGILHDFILNPATRGTKGEAIIAGARVIGIRKLQIKHPVRGTVMPEVIKA